MIERIEAFAVSESAVIQTRDLPRIGLIVLATDLTVERDFRLLAQQHGIALDLYVSRIHFANPITTDSLAAMQADLSMAAGLLLPDCELDAIVFACTSASALLGEAAVTAAIQQGKPHVPVITTAAAAITQLQQLKAQHISILAPYSRAVSCMLAEYFEQAGFNISALTYMDMADDRDIACLDPALLMQAVRYAAAQAPKAEALFVSCTATRAAERIAVLQDMSGRAVMSSNYAAFWQAMQYLQLAEPPYCG